VTVHTEIEQFNPVAPIIELLPVPGITVLVQDRPAIDAEIRALDLVAPRIIGISDPGKVFVSQRKLTVYAEVRQLDHTPARVERLPKSRVAEGAKGRLVVHVKIGPAGLVTARVVLVSDPGETLPVGEHRLAVHAKIKHLNPVAPIIELLPVPGIAVLVQDRPVVESEILALDLVAARVVGNGKLSIAVPMQDQLFVGAEIGHFRFVAAVVEFLADASRASDGVQSGYRLAVHAEHEYVR